MTLLVSLSGRDFDVATTSSHVRGVTMANKSPDQHNVKKVGKSLKEKRNDKHAKKEIKKGLGEWAPPGARESD
jgi:hypothetical protein